MIAGPRAGTAQIGGDDRPELQEPAADGLIGDVQAPLGEHLLDEMVIVIQRKRYWLWRAVDNEGEVLDFLVQSRRNAKAAKS